VSDITFDLVISPTARRRLAEVLPESVAFAAFEFITGPLLANSQRVGKRLGPPLSDRHSARRGTYWVIYRIDDGNAIVTALAVVRRADAYRCDQRGETRQRRPDHRHRV
jgi:mRNA-degrading endonuclease RelE of RelBE toxin-antitoxin system